MHSVQIQIRTDRMIPIGEIERIVFYKSIKDGRDIYFSSFRVVDESPSCRTMVDDGLRRREGGGDA